MTTTRTHAPIPPMPTRLPLPLESVSPQDADVLIDLPEQEWCNECAPTDDPDETGMPQDIVDTQTEVEVTTMHGTGPEYQVLTLACGHAITVG